MNCFFSSLEIASLRAYYIFIREMAVESVQDKENKSEVEDPHQNIEPWLRTHNGKETKLGLCFLQFVIWCWNVLKIQRILDAKKLSGTNRKILQN